MKNTDRYRIKYLNKKPSQENGGHTVALYVNDEFMGVFISPNFAMSVVIALEEYDRNLVEGEDDGLEAPRSRPRKKQKAKRKP